jgi:hypothetical protein
MLHSLLVLTAVAELVHFKHMDLKKVQDKSICLTFSHEKVETAPRSPTNTDEAIECRVKVWPEILGKVSEQTFDEHDVNVAAFATFALNEKKELCFDFSQRLLPQEKIEDVGRVAVRCAPQSKAAKIFAKLK